MSGIPSVEPLASHRHAHEATGLPDEEGEPLGGRELGGEDEVALVLAIRVVKDEDGSAGAEVVERVADGNRSIALV